MKDRQPKLFIASNKKTALGLHISTLIGLTRHLEERLAGVGMKPGEGSAVEVLAQELLDDRNELR